MPSDPSGAVAALVVIGAVLVVIEGALEVAIGIVVASVGIAGAGLAAGLGAAAILLGVVLLVLGAVYYFSPDLHVGLGAAIIVVATFSLLLGGGFIIGFILAVIGGILALALSHDDAFGPMDWVRPAVRPTTVASGGSPSPPPAVGAPGAAQMFTSATVVRFCLVCGAQNPLRNAQCRACGSALRPRTA